jgi:hypothetical protein
LSEEPILTVQLLLTVPVVTLEEVRADNRRHLIAALADLLLDAAMRSGAAKEGGSDEREDP